MKIEYAILIYLVGCLVSYFMGRRNFKAIDGKYTVGNRVTNLVIAFFSWGGFLFGLISAIIEEVCYKTDQKKEAKW